jgi:hypothetical protein
MRPHDWAAVMDKIQAGEFEKYGVHPETNILGMKITEFGVNMLTVRGRYGEEADTTFLNFPYELASEEHEAVDHFANEPEPKPPQKEKKTKDVKRLFKRIKK